MATLAPNPTVDGASTERFDTFPTTRALDALFYPESDGNPIADNTTQYRWINTLQGGIAAEMAHDPHVFVAGDLLWYPVEGDNRLRMAPDILVAFGRPQGDRGSYLQWREEGIAPQVVFEVLSPGNRAGEMRAKFAFYERFGVEEYYLQNPATNEFQGWLRDAGDSLRPIEPIDGWVSPRLGIKFVGKGNEPLLVFHRNGEPFQTFQELVDDRDEQRRAREYAERERTHEQQARRWAEEERNRVAADLAAERQAREALLSRLRTLGIDPDAL